VNPEDIAAYLCVDHQHQYQHQHPFPGSLTSTFLSGVGVGVGVGDPRSAQVNRDDIAAYLASKKKEGWVILGLEQALF